MSATPSASLDEFDALVAEVMVEWQILGPDLRSGEVGCSTSNNPLHDHRRQCRRAGQVE